MLWFASPAAGWALTNLVYGCPAGVASILTIVASCLLDACSLASYPDFPKSCAPEPEYIASLMYPFSSHAPPLSSATLLDVYASSSQSCFPSLYIVPISLFCPLKISLHLQVESCHCSACLFHISSGSRNQSCCCSYSSIIRINPKTNRGSSITSSSSTPTPILTPDILSSCWTTAAQLLCCHCPAFRPLRVKHKFHAPARSYGDLSSGLN